MCLSWRDLALQKLQALPLDTFQRTLPEYFSVANLKCITWDAQSAIEEHFNPANPNSLEHNTHKALDNV